MPHWQQNNLVSNISGLLCRLRRRATSLYQSNDLHELLVLLSESSAVAFKKLINLSKCMFYNCLKDLDEDLSESQLNQCMQTLSGCGDLLREFVWLLTNLLCFFDDCLQSLFNQLSICELIVYFFNLFNPILLLAGKQ